MDTATFFSPRKRLILLFILIQVDWNICRTENLKSINYWKNTCIKNLSNKLLQRRKFNTAVQIFDIDIMIRMQVCSVNLKISYYFCNL